MVNVNKLRGKIVEKGMTVEAVAKAMGIDKSTLYRKLQAAETITIREANAIGKILGLTMQESIDIFLASMAHEMRLNENKNNHHAAE